MPKLKSAKELGITEQHRLNLARLTIFVRKFVDDKFFDMATFNKENDYASKAVYECGTTACFCGFGPLAGIETKRFESWGDYGTRVFGADEHDTYEIWQMLFSAEHVNSKIAAARRGAYFLMNGIPSEWSPYINAYTWEAPESFRPGWKVIQELAESQKGWTLKEAVAKAKKVSNFAK